jgi:hypothetical protein
MTRKLILMLAVRALGIAVGVAALLMLLLLLPIPLAHGGGDVSAALRELSPGVSWSGMTTVGGGQADPAACIAPQACDDLTLDVDIGPDYRARNPEFTVRVRIDWDDPADKLKLSIHKDGTVIGATAREIGNGQELRLDHPANGTYHIITRAAEPRTSTEYSGSVKIVEKTSEAPDAS